MARPKEPLKRQPVTRRELMRQAIHANSRKGGWRGAQASLDALARHRPAAPGLAGRPCQRHPCRRSAVRGADLCPAHGGIQQAINRDPTGPVARRYARSRRFARNGDEAARKVIWRALPARVRRVVTRWGLAGGWSWPERVSAGGALAAYVAGDGRVWRDWIAGARARGIPDAVNPADIAALERADAPA